MTTVSAGVRALASPAQRRLWFESQMRAQADAASAYHSAMTLRLAEDTDVPALTRALSFVWQRHAVLRTTYAVVDGAVVQVVGPVVDPLVEPDGAVRETASEDLDRLLQEEFTRPFDLEAGPVSRTVLHRCPDGTLVLQVVIHHVATDEWSMGILRDELTEAYAAERAGRRPDLPDLPLQYTDYAVAALAHLDSPGHRIEMDYWREQLADAPRLLDLPVDRPRPPTQSFRTGTLDLRLPDEAVRRLRDLAAGQRVSAFTLLLTMVQVALSRWTGQPEVVIGIPSANRMMPGTDRLVGFFSDLLPLRLTSDESRSPAQLVRTTQGTVLDAFDHSASFDTIVEAVGPERTRATTPLFQAVFSYADGSEGPASLGTHLPVDYDAESHFDLTVVAESDDSGIVLWTAYATDILDESTVRGFLDAVLTTVDTFLDDPRTPLAARPRLSADAAVRVAALSRGEDLEVTSALVDLLATAGAPGDPAVEDGEEHLTYDDLRTRSDHLAAALVEAGVGPGQVVGALLPRGADLIVALIGILKSGGAYLPLDPSLPADRLDYFIDDSGAQVVVHRGAPASAGPRLPGISRVDLAALRPRTPPDRSPHPDQIAYVIYTSGTSGRPKGVEVTHRGLDNMVAWYVRESGLTAGDRSSQLVTPSSDGSLLEMLPPLAAGACIVVVPEEARLDFDHLWTYLASAGVTVSFMVTPTLRASAGSAPPRHPTLTRLLVGGESLGEVPSTPCPLVNLYGPTETTVVGTSGLLTRTGAVAHIGRPLPNTHARVLDQWLRPVAVREVGELFLAGPHVARGYLGRPGLTARRFVPDVVAADGTRMYHTGDRAYWDEEGNLVFLGRVDQQVKIRGFRVEPGEIETVLMQSPGVREAVVVVSDAEGAAPVLAAFCRLEPGADAHWATAATEVARRQLPEHMVPARLVAVARFPLSGTGKVDRGALVLPPLDEAATTDAHVEPSGAVQSVVASVWREVLGVEQVSANDDFFRVGGNSLLVMKVAGRLEDGLGVEIKLDQIFSHPVLADLAAHLEERVFAQMEVDGVG